MKIKNPQTTAGFLLVASSRNECHIDDSNLKCQTSIKFFYVNLKNMSLLQFFVWAHAVDTDGLRTKKSD